LSLEVPRVDLAGPSWTLASIFGFRWAACTGSSMEMMEHGEGLPDQLRALYPGLGQFRFQHFADSLLKQRQPVGQQCRCEAGLHMLTGHLIAIFEIALSSQGYPPEVSDQLLVVRPIFHHRKGSL